MNNKIMIITQDKYGVPFFRKFTNRLKDEKFIPNVHIDSSKFYGACNPKLSRQLTAFKYLRCYDHFIIVADADGGHIETLHENILCHIPENFKIITSIIIFKDEIEEWICYSDNIDYEKKPSQILREKKGYEKYRLPSYASKLDILKLKSGCESFCNFFEKITLCCSRVCPQ